MLKWAAKKDGRGVLGFGLDPDNIRLLQAGRPIIARVAINGAIVDIVIHFGESTEKMQADLKISGLKISDSTIVMPGTVN